MVRIYGEVMAVRLLVVAFGMVYTLERMLANETNG